MWEGRREKKGSVEGGKALAVMSECRGGPRAGAAMSADTGRALCPACAPAVTAEASAGFPGVGEAADNATMEPARIAVVVVSQRSGATLDACLGRLRAAAEVAQVRVVDNGSADDSVAIVQRHAVADARVRFIANPDDPGFAVACNQGAAATDAPWLVFVDPAVMVERNTLAHLRGLAAAAGPALLGVDRVDEAGRPLPVLRCDVPDFAALLTAPGRACRRERLADGRALQPVPALAAGLLLLPRSLFECLQGWDPGYRRALADLDLCRRAGAAGALVGIANGLQVVQVCALSRPGSPLAAEWDRQRGLWRYFRKFEAARQPRSRRLALTAALVAHATLRLAAILAANLRASAVSR